MILHSYFICLKIAQDVPKYMMVAGERAELRGLNLEGLQRHGFTAQEVCVKFFFSCTFYFLMLNWMSKRAFIPLGKDLDQRPENSLPKNIHACWNFQGFRWTSGWHGIIFNHIPHPLHDIILNRWSMALNSFCRRCVMNWLIYL